MNLSVEHFLLFASVIVFAGIIIGKVGSRFGIPALLLFLFTGMLFGVDGLGFSFSNTQMVQNVGMVALTIILFTGGMDTRLQQIRPVMLQGIMLSTLGVLLTTLFTGLFIYFLSNQFALGYVFSLPLSLLLAATMSSTDSASVFALLRSQRVHLKENLKPALELESGSNDPMAYMLTIVLIEYLTKATPNPWHILWDFVLQFLLGGAFGLLFGYLSTKMINRLHINNRMLYPIMLLSMVLFIFSISTILQSNGYLAVYIAGIVVGNSPLRHRGSINHFFEGITWLLQIILFLMLGLLVNPHDMMNTLLLAGLVGFFMMLLARPLACMITLLPFRKMSFSAKSFISWVGLRGAAPIIFATYPIVAEVPGANSFYDIVFVITLLSLLFQGMTITPVARFLGLASVAPPEGNFVGVEIPEETGTQMHETLVDHELLQHGPLLKNIDLQSSELVILVKRKERFIVPKGDLRLHLGDILLVVSQTESSAWQQSDILLETLRRKLNRSSS